MELGAVELGSEVLRTCRDFDHLLEGDVSTQAANSPKILEALQAVAGELFEFEAISINTDTLNDRMVLDHDLTTVTSTMLVAKVEDWQETPVRHAKCN